MKRAFITCLLCIYSLGMAVDVDPQRFMMRYGFP